VRDEALLERYRFDPVLFEELRQRVADGELSPEANRLTGRVEPPPEDELVRLPPTAEPGFEEAFDAGLAAFTRGEIAVAVLNGGMATRFGGVVKGIVEAVDGRSFLELKAREAARAAAASGGDVPFVVMNGFATDEATRAFVAERGLPEPLFFSQSVLLRLTRDGDLFLTADGFPSPYSPGHGDFVPSLRASGILAALRERGVRTLMLSNVDNLGARPDPVVLGMHLRSGRRLTAEVTAKAPGDVGGAPARVDGRTMHVEHFRFPRDFEQEAIRVFGTNSFTIDLDALDAEYPLTWLYVEKTVDGRPAVQLERLVNELTSFLPTLFLEVPRTGPRGRFFPVKEPRDLVASQRRLREMLATSPFER
jgi:UTP--glucose-1-phosphate uridylyltransferase